jgi:hypothetical protein
MADLEVLIDTPTHRLIYHRDTNIVHHELRRFVHGEPFRGLLERGVEVMEERHAIKWLSDDRGNAPVKPNDSEWCKTIWFPRALAAGWKHWAVVMPEGVLGQMNMRRWIETYAESGLNAHPFSDPDAALGWLSEQP